MSSIPVTHPDSISYELDREQAFLLYATFCGDVERTAHALNIAPTAILKVADEEGWSERLGGIIKLKKSNRPGDIERAINRAMNFVQAHRMRLCVERVIKKMTKMNEDELNEFLFPPTGMRDNKAYGKKFSARAIADLASAMEKAQAMTYLALSDTSQERIKRKEQADGATAGGELHAQIAEAMSKFGKSTSPRALLFDAQLAEAQEQQQKSLIEVRKPVNPLDNDNH